MAEQIVSDLLMKFVELDNQPIIGEVMTQLPTTKGPMLKGFDQQHMFEVESFSFKTGLGGEEADKKSQEQKKQADTAAAALNDHANMVNDMASTVNQLTDMHNQLAGSLNAINEHLRALRLPSASPRGTPQLRSVNADAKGVEGNAKTLKGSSNQGFQKFRDGTMTDKTRYPVDMKPMQFERSIDRTSTILLHHCIQRIPFKSATLIKRKAAGGPASGEVFLRFDFNTVLIKSVDWDDGTPVKETVEFICRAVTIHYKPQLPDGTLGAAIQAFWKASDSSSITAENLNSSS